MDCCSKVIRCNNDNNKDCKNSNRRIDLHNVGYGSSYADNGRHDILHHHNAVCDLVYFLFVHIHPVVLQEKNKHRQVSDLFYMPKYNLIKLKRTIKGVE